MKQETVEEVAERLYPINNTGSMFMPNRDELNNSYKQEGFIEGYKLAQERMEEELLKFANWCRIEDNKTPNRVITIQQLFEQFKKK